MFLSHIGYDLVCDINRDFDVSTICILGRINTLRFKVQTLQHSNKWFYFQNFKNLSLHGAEEVYMSTGRGRLVTLRTLAIIKCYFSDLTQTLLSNINDN